MLTEPRMEEMLPKAACAYELAVLVSKRANQLVEGAQPMISEPAANMVSLACKEIAEGKVVGVKGNLKKGEYAVPLTKEAREAISAEKKAREAQEANRRYAQENDFTVPEYDPGEQAANIAELIGGDVADEETAGFDGDEDFTPEEENA